MIRFVNWLAIATLCAMASGCIAADSQADANTGPTVFPVLKADDLNGREVTLPRDFPGDPTLVFVAFKQRQQSNVNQWVDALSLADRPEIPWVELPTINAGFRIMKGFVDNGMRSGITATEARGRTISIYGQSDLMDPLGIDSTDEILALVVKQDGTVLDMVVGDPTESGIAKMAAAMGVSFSLE